MEKDEVEDHMADSLPEGQDGSIAEVDDLVEFIYFVGGKTELKGLYIEVKEKNCFYITYNEDNQLID